MEFIYCAIIGLVIGMMLEKLEPILHEEHLKRVEKRKKVVNFVKSFTVRKHSK